MKIRTIIEIIIGCIVTVLFSTIIAATVFIATALLLAYVLWDITILTKVIMLIFDPLFLRLVLLVFLIVLINGIRDDIKWNRRFKKDVN